MYDVVIAGGGLVGASLAVALVPLGLKVALIDASSFQVTETTPAYDDRSVALSYGSSLIYQGMGLADQILAEAEPIRQVHVSDQGFFGATRLHAKQQGVPALGYVIETRILGSVLYRALQACAVDVLAPASVKQLQMHQDYVTLHLQGDAGAQSLQARLLVVADGANSSLREQLGVGVKRHDYQQVAVIANVTTQKPHDNIAYERFTRNGPLALLPMTRQRYSLVWTQKQSQADEVMVWGDQLFQQQLQHAFGYRQGYFLQAGQRSAFPLSLVKSDQDVAHRSVIIGNASHALHPVAGQGLNLSLRDVAALVDVIAQAQTEKSDPGLAAYLQQYQRQRAADYRITVPYTDFLVRAFCQDFPGLGHVRAGGLLSMDRIAPLRDWFGRQSMGLAQRQARLARGLHVRRGNV